MQIRTFVAENMPAALDQVRSALGSEAMLLKTRMVRQGAQRHVEITAAADQLRIAPPPEGPNVDQQAWGYMTRELDRAEDRLGEAAGGDPQSEWLQAADFLPDVSESLLAATRVADARRAALTAAIVERVQVGHGVLPLPDRPRRIALIGPPGAGKTTALVKIAALASSTGRTDLAIVNLDTYRPGAEDYLSQVGETLRIPVLSESTPDVQKGLVDAEGLILIDTDSRIFAAEPGSVALRASLQRLQPDLVALVLPATWRSVDLHEALGRYLVCRPSHLIFSGLDLTQRYGGILSIAITTGLPVACVLTTGRFDSGVRTLNPELLIQQMETLSAAGPARKETSRV